MSRRIDRSTLPGKEELLKMQDEGLSIEAIARRIGRSPKLAKKLLVEYGLYERTRSAYKTGVLPSGDILIEENKKMNITKLAEKYGCSRTSVRDKIKRYIENNDLIEEISEDLFEEWKHIHDGYLKYKKRMNEIEEQKKNRRVFFSGKVIAAKDIPYGYIY